MNCGITVMFWKFLIVAFPDSMCDTAESFTIFIFEYLKLRQYAALLAASSEDYRAKMKNFLENGFGKVNVKANICLYTHLCKYINVLEVSAESFLTMK